MAKKRETLEELPGRKVDKRVLMDKNVMEFEGIIFNYDEIKGAAEDWFGSHKYIVSSTSGRERATPLGNEVMYKLTAIKPADRYSRYTIKLEWMMRRVNDVKMKGVDKPLKVGNIRLKIDAHIDKDYEHTFGGSKFQQFLKHMYEKYVYERTLFRHVVQLWTESNAIYSLIKKETTKYV